MARLKVFLVTFRQASNEPNDEVKRRLGLIPITRRNDDFALRLIVQDPHDIAQSEPRRQSCLRIPATDGQDAGHDTFAQRAANKTLLIFGQDKRLPSLRALGDDQSF